LAGTLQAQFAQSHSDGIHIIGRHRAGGKQRHLPAPALVLHLDRLAPCLTLTGIDLAEIKHLALHDTAI